MTPSLSTNGPQETSSQGEFRLTFNSVSSLVIGGNDVTRDFKAVRAHNSSRLAILCIIL